MSRLAEKNSIGVEVTREGYQVLGQLLDSQLRAEGVVINAKELIAGVRGEGFLDRGRLEVMERAAQRIAAAARALLDAPKEPAGG